MNTSALAATFAALAVALFLRGRPGTHRLAAGRSSGLSLARWPRATHLAAHLRSSDVAPRSRRLHRTAAAIAATACLLLTDLPWSAAVAAIVYLVVPVALSRLQPSASRKRSACIAADLPLAVDLLAACLRAGRPPEAALVTVSQALSGPLAELLTDVERRLNLGADPSAAWSVLTTEPSCAAFGRAVQRALRSGAPLATTLESHADDARQARRWSAEEQARAVETRSVLPLGLCFLPAFVLLGIVPTIATTLTSVLTDLSP